jgi:hypothetical protein
MRDLDSAVIICGTGRCGSTLLHRLLGHHEDLGWLSSAQELLPRLAWPAAMSRLYRPGVPERIRSSRPFPKPYETYEFWEARLPGFKRRDKPPNAAHVPSAAIERVRTAVARVLRYHGRRRLLVKVTGWSRIAYFDRIFPRARFLILDRDPRAVISSWMKAGWLDVTSAPGTPGWQWGPVPRPYLQLWRELGATPALSAAIKVQLDLDDIAANEARLPERCLRLSYERLTAFPEEVLMRALDFCALPPTRSLERGVASTSIRPAEERWRSHLGADDAEAIAEFFARTG